MPRSRNALHHRRYHCSLSPPKCTYCVVPPVDLVLYLNTGQSHGFAQLVGGATKNGVINHCSGSLRARYTYSTDTVLTMPSQAPSGLSNAPVSTNYTVYFSPPEEHIQQILSVTLSATGILYALVSVYWFARMKRVFRHQYVNRCCQVPSVRVLETLISSQTYHVTHHEWHVQVIVVLHPGCIRPCLWSYIASILPG